MGGPGVQGDRQHGEEPGLAEEEGQVHRKVSDYRVTRQFGERVGFTIIPGAEVTQEHVEAAHLQVNYQE